MPPRADVLIIEDSEDLRTVLLELLRDEGYRAVGAGTGIEGLRLLGELKPRMILCDVMLPGIDGFSVWKQSKRACAEWGTAFVFVSAGSAPGPGATDVPFLSKPFDLSDLLEVVEQNVRRVEQSAGPIVDFPTLHPAVTFEAKANEAACRPNRTTRLKR